SKRLNDTESLGKKPRLSNAVNAFETTWKRSLGKNKEQFLEYVYETLHDFSEWKIFRVPAIQTEEENYSALLEYWEDLMRPHTCRLCKSSDGCREMNGNIWSFNINNQPTFFFMCACDPRACSYN
uniref:Uncharacterized protein n=1 Tax=Ciona intestinalis TaxID=7719 RepID=H2XLQ5_CIOIN